MAVKLRLRRHGKKKHPTYRVVATDSRSPRDGRFIDLIGRYDPHPHPSVVEIDNERALYWLEVGAQPSAAVKKLLEISGAWGQFRVKRGDVHVVGEVAVPEARERKSRKVRAREADAAEALEEAAPAAADGAAAEADAPDAEVSAEVASAEVADETKEVASEEVADETEEAAAPAENAAAETVEEDAGDAPEAVADTEEEEGT